MKRSAPLSDYEKQYVAPDGSIWVCGACGRHGKARTRIGDESCFLKAVLVPLAKCVFEKRKLVGVRQ